MRPISQKNREIISNDPYYRQCARHMDGSCDGRITIEHALIFGGKQIDELWNLIPLCEFHHGIGKHQDGGNLIKEKNIWLALNRATVEELKAISKVIPYLNMRERLNKIYVKS